jgi:hypothetical protein
VCSALTAAVSIYMPHKATSATTRILYDGQHLSLVNDQLIMYTRQQEWWHTFNLLVTSLLSGL